ncbi:MAG: peptidase, partial [Alphaproteobacteria bacterium PA3]
PRFRNSSGDADRQKAVASDFGISTVWMTDVAETLADGRIVIDIAPFLAMDTLGIAPSLNLELDSLGVGTSASLGGKGFRLEDKLSLADPASVKLFPDNLEIDAVQTYVSDNPGAEVENIVPDPKKVTLSVHHSFVRLPAPGFKPMPFDPRLGGFATQVVDFGAPLGAAVVSDLANRFRLEKVDPAATRSRVKKPITYYLDRNTPEQIRPALLEGVGWWNDAFDAAGFIDAFKVELLPEGADPLDVRYNMVTWVDRATRGWAYGQQIVDPRTGEIVKGMVVLGSLRARQDIQIFQALVGAGEATVRWLYGEAGEAEVTKAAADFRFVQDDNARAPDTAYAWGGLWDDGADPVAELGRMMQVRAAALSRFGLGALAPGEPVANLRRRFVPLWLLHRYQLVTAAKQVGGTDFTYAVNGSGREASQAVAPAQQRAALEAILATIRPEALRVPTGLLPLLSAAQNGNSDRQYDTEIFARLTGTVLGATGDDLGRRIAYRTLVTMAQVARRHDTTPEVAAALDQTLEDVGRDLAKRKARGDERAWALSLSRRLLDADQREKLAASLPRAVSVPPGDPIGEEGWMDLASLLAPLE